MTVDDPFDTCETCQWWIALSRSDASVICHAVSEYARVKNDPTAMQAFRKAIARCGICVRKSEVRKYSDSVCKDGFDCRVR